MQKHQSSILWISSILFVLLLSYFKNVTSSTYPISGTISIEGEKVIYAFDKIYRGKESFAVALRTDNKNLHGILILQKSVPDTIPLTFKNGWLQGKIPLQPPGTIIKYKVYLQTEKSYRQIPDGVLLSTKFVGSVPNSLSSTYVVLFFIGLVLSVRIGLAYFGFGGKIKTYALFTLISFSLCGLFLTPVIRLYEMGAVNTWVPPMFDMFSLPKLFYAGVWFVISVGMFNSKSKLWYAAGALFTVAGFLLLN